jgi:hypothetical protein
MSTQEFSTGFEDGQTTGFSTGWSSSTTGGSSGASGGFTLNRNSRAVFIEQVVRPNESPRILALRARRKAREEDRSDDSLIRWGRPSEYGNKDESRGGVSIANSNPKKDPQQQPRRERIYTEVERTTETVRVRNPQDANQYVDVARIKSIRFRGPDGTVSRFDLKPPGGEVV